MRGLVASSCIGMGLMFVACAQHGVGAQRGTLRGAEAAVEKGSGPAPVGTLVNPTLDLEPDFRPDPTIRRGLAGGSINIHEQDPTCSGFISERPSQVLNLAAGFGMLRIFAVSHSDISLVIRGPGGKKFCNDDRFAHDPGIDLDHPVAGRYEVFVGSFDPTGRYEYALAATEIEAQTPDQLALDTQQHAHRAGSGSSEVAAPTLTPNDPVRFGTVNVARSFRPYQFDGSTGGSLNAAGLAASDETCRGWVTAAPSFMLHVTAATRLRLSVRSSADTTVVIGLPTSNYLCHDDVGAQGEPGYDMNPNFEQDFAPGDYPVWIGGYAQGEVRPFRFKVEKVTGR